MDQVWVAFGSAVVYLTAAIILCGLAYYGALYVWAVWVLARTWWQNRGES